METKKYNKIENGINYTVVETFNNEKTTIKWFNKNLELSRIGKPAILEYKNEKLVSWMYLKDGILHNEKNKPAFVIKNRYSVWAENGLITRNNKPAVIAYDYINKNKKKTLEIFCQFNKVHNKNDSAINLYELESVETSISTRIFAQYNENTKGFNLYSYQNNNLISKETKKIRYNIIIDNIFRLINWKAGTPSDYFEYSKYSIERDISLALKLSEYQGYQENLSNLISFNYKNDKQKLKSLNWYKGSEKHRIDKPAIINFDNNKVSFFYYENGIATETQFKPYFFEKQRYGKVFRVLKFQFKDSKIQSFYDQNNLIPFYLSPTDIKMVELNFNV